MLERIDKFLVHNGFGSRKEIKSLVNKKFVSVNGEIIRDVSFKIDSEKDEISVNGEIVEAQTFIYLMMNKPAGYVSVKKEGVHSTVFDLLEEKYSTPFFAEHLHCVGRLDVDTEGFLLLTTDGKLTHRITSPKTHSPKKYFVRLASAVPPDAQNEYAKKCAKGIYVEAEGKEPAFRCKPAVLDWKLSDSASEDSASASVAFASECFLTITEGKFHQVKRMFLALGNEVTYLKRVAIGNLELDPTLEKGEYREMAAEEVELLEIEKS